MKLSCALCIGRIQGLMLARDLMPLSQHDAIEQMIAVERERAYSVHDHAFIWDVQLHRSALEFGAALEGTRLPT